jgi:apolipoprotein N-acyltransferase
MSMDVMTEEQPTLHPPAPAPRKDSQRDYEPTVQDILARAKTNRPQAKGAWFCGGMTGLLLWCAFTPLDWGWLGWVSLVPLLLLARIQQPTHWMYRAVYATGLAYSLATLQWMPLGDVSMYPAWVALSAYIAMYFPVFLFAVRVAVHRFRTPLIIAAPLIWVGLEYFRAHLMTGFAWYFLGHTQYRWLEVIQISDLVGAYGVSFLLAMSSATLASLVPASLFRRWKLVLDTKLERGTIATPRRPAVVVAAFLAVFTGALTYGLVRRGQAEFAPGPRVAVVQGNFVSSVNPDPQLDSKMFAQHDRLTGLAVAEHQPDLIVWPETGFPWPLAQVESGMTDEELIQLAPPALKREPEHWIRFWRGRQTERTLFDRSQAANAALMIGVSAHVASSSGLKNFNSAVFVDPRVGIAGRYDKVHRVPFGEYVPLRETLPFLQALTPFPDDFGIEAGSEFTSFDYKGWSFAPIICFEDTVPQVVRAAATATREGQSVDCLVNLTNDGWFHGSSELNQHLITSVFRAVECRTPLVRSVNTGISAFIDGDGAILEPAVFHDDDDQGRTSMTDSRGRFHKSLNALLVHEVPLDNRRSPYLNAGDWFAASCGFLVLFVTLSGIFWRGFSGELPRGR